MLLAAMIANEAQSVENKEWTALTVLL